MTLLEQDFTNFKMFFRFLYLFYYYTEIIIRKEKYEPQFVVSVRTIHFCRAISKNTMIAENAHDAENLVDKTENEFSITFGTHLRRVGVFYSYFLYYLICFSTFLL